MTNPTINVPVKPLVQSGEHKLNAGDCALVKYSYKQHCSVDIETVKKSQNSGLRDAAIQVPYVILAASMGANFQQALAKKLSTEFKEPNPGRCEK